MLYEKLKRDKVMSQETFDGIYMKANNIRFKHGSFNKLFATTVEFLKDHDLVTRQIINGLIVFTATQKCFRTHTFENATVEYQTVSNTNIDRAIKYVELNDDAVPAEFEGPVVANILGLEGKVWKFFVNSYNYQEEWKSGNTPYGLPIKYKVIGVVMNLESSGHIKKV
jgi:hypothetical protein